MITPEISQNQIDAFYSPYDQVGDVAAGGVCQRKIFEDISVFFSSLFKSTPPEFEVINTRQVVNEGYTPGDRRFFKRFDSAGRIVWVTAAVVAVIGSVAVIATAVAAAPVSAPIAPLAGTALGTSLSVVAHHIC